MEDLDRKASVMRVPLVYLALVITPTIGCVSRAVDEPILRTDPVPFSGRVRLEATINDVSTGIRFADGAVVSKEQGVKDDERVDLEFAAGRDTVFRTPGGEICRLPGKVASLDEVDPTSCAAFVPQLRLSLTGSTPSDADKSGLVARTRAGTARLWIADSGWDVARAVDFVLVDYALELP